jgi:hypothetical protein
LVVKNILKNALVLIGSIFLCLFFVEIFVRIIESDVKVIDKKWHKKNVHFNSLGLRDREFSSNKPENTFRILVLGDSQTLGHGIDRLEDTYPKKLEKKLNQKSSNINFEVINVADSGWNTDTQLYKFLQYGIKLDPDLVILAYYLNDIPWPHEIKCSGKDVFRTPGISIWGDIVFRSKAIKFFKFRKNRLLEKFGDKISVPECFNLAYDSRAWEMEKFYLDHILMATQVKRIHFMVSLIPAMFSLDDNFPFKKINTKLNQYCSEKNIECIDLFKTTFKGADASSLVVSKYDRHLNAKAAEMVSDGMFEKLEKLTEYKNLPKYHRGFSLKELMGSENTIVSELDNKFAQLRRAKGSLNKVIENINWEIESGLSKNLLIKKRTINPISKNVEYESIATLSDSGQLTQFEEKKDEKGDAPFRQERLNVLGDRSILSIFLNRKEVGTDVFLLESLEINSRQVLRITEQITFIDPKVIEQSLFETTGNISGPQAEETIYDSLEFYYTGVSSGKWSWKKYALALSSEIEKEKPSIAALKAVAQFYLKNGLFKRLKNLKEVNPKLGFLLERDSSFSTKLSRKSSLK